jgi:hypothetical protein
VGRAWTRIRWLRNKHNQHAIPWSKPYTTLNDLKPLTRGGVLPPVQVCKHYRLAQLGVAGDHGVKLKSGVSE